jgi:hypothetical protein
LKVVILQPSYIPWRGYFDQIYKADLFVFYDDVQYDKRGWRNRNRIKTSTGPIWLSIPVFNRGAQTEHISINEIRIVWDRPWNQEHWNSIRMAYSKAPFFSQYAGMVEEFYSKKPEMLADFTIDTTITLAKTIGIDRTRFMRSSQIIDVEGTKTDRLISILKKVEATHYISGPSAKDYIEKDKFDAAGISLEYIEYGYPEYPQLYPPFDQQVSILDTLFMMGKETLTTIHR